MIKASAIALLARRERDIVQISHDGNAARTFGLRAWFSDFGPNYFTSKLGTKFRWPQIDSMI
jgi:hypothetical protein